MLIYQRLEHIFLEKNATFSDSGVEGPGDQISPGSEGCASNVAMA